MKEQKYTPSAYISYMEYLVCNNNGENKLFMVWEKFSSILSRKVDRFAVSCLCHQWNCSHRTCGICGSDLQAMCYDRTSVLLHRESCAIVQSQKIQDCTIQINTSTNNDILSFNNTVNTNNSGDNGVIHSPSKKSKIQVVVISSRYCCIQKK